MGPFRISFLKKSFLYFFLFFFLTGGLRAQIITVGKGSYSMNFPGTDAAGRNGFPGGTPFTTGSAALKPAPTNDWWSHKIKNAHSANLFNYPLTMKTTGAGLVITYIPGGPIDDIEPITMGVKGLNASAAMVSEFSDWMITMQWSSGTHQFEATSGIGMPFVYFKKKDSDSALVSIKQGNVTVDNEKLLIEDARNGGDFIVFAPKNSAWIKQGNNYTSDLNGKNYWSVVFVPEGVTDLSDVAADLQKYAYVFPVNTEVNWRYNESNAVLTSTFTTQVDVKEGTDSLMLQGVLPHQWANFSNTAPTVLPHFYETVRGRLKTIAANQFSVENAFHGILPTLPYLDFKSEGYHPGLMQEKIKLLKNDALSTWTDSYNEGQEMNRLIQTARIAQLTGDTSSFRALFKTVKDRLEDWLSAESNEKAFLFYYVKNWSALIGYPAGHGQDHNLNDHHFHWGYFIHAASFIEQFEPGWAEDWGGMINLLVRDAASEHRDDTLFPFLRNFSPFAGHSWANGFASFPQGNDQESTSESMQFNSSLIHWGSVTGNKAIRDLGIYLYTTEQTAIEEYWFDRHERNFKPNQPYSLVSRVWGNSYDNGTFWTNDIAASYGIEMYPIHGGSLYLGHDSAYVSKLWTEIEKNTGILRNEVNPNLWHDIKWQYLSFIDPAKAIRLYDSNPNRTLKFGVSDAFTYHWLHSINVLGRANHQLTSNHPLAVAFVKNGDTTYVAQNYSSREITVEYANGFRLNVPPGALVTSKDAHVSGVLSSSFNQAYPGGSVHLNLAITSGNAGKVEFYKDTVLLGTVHQGPFEWKADKLSLGIHTFYAKIFDGSDFNISNLVEVMVGEQIPYKTAPIVVPGTIEAGYYDLFEGGNGNSISYLDLSRGIAGDFRIKEDADAKADAGEGTVLAWIANNEWVEYSIDVKNEGLYDMTFRYASGNSSGGGPFAIYSDHQLVKGNILVPATGDWNTWKSKTVTDIPLKKGEQILRILFEGGEFNLGKMSFVYRSALNYNQPYANAGANQLITLPDNQTSLDGTQSLGNNLNYKWEQVYGPSVLQFNNQQSSQTSVQGLMEGVYKIKLTVGNDTLYDEDELFIISSSSINIPPVISILNPENGQVFLKGENVNISAVAKDINDTVGKVEFWVNQTRIASLFQAPFEFTWNPSDTGEHLIKAIAYDGFGNSSVSENVLVFIKPKPPCRAISSNKEFEYEFSPDDNNPSITFIPSLSNMGSPTCILYYGTNAGLLPGYGVTPNVPFRINAKKGEKIYFYYTYSHPNSGERNNSAKKDEYIIGSCQSATNAIEAITDELSYYPNPVSDLIHLHLNKEMATIDIYNAQGKRVFGQNYLTSEVSIDMSQMASGIYCIIVQQDTQNRILKVLKN